MTEREKMLSGMVYDTRDKELRELSSRAKNIMRIYNSLPAEDVTLRNNIIGQIFGECGQNVRVNQPLNVDYGCNIFIGSNSLINMNCTLLDTGRIEIGSNTLIGPDVKIYTAVHPLNGKERFDLQEDGSFAVRTSTMAVKIGDYVWVGGGTIILPGVSIGDNAVIGAGSVVTKDIPANAIACGNPCAVKKYQKENFQP